MNTYQKTKPYSSNSIDQTQSDNGLSSKCV
jgi:hypothetical protein